MDAPTVDAHALLCERCGYALDGLRADGVCPECGTPVSASDPRRRRGSAWQRGPSPWSWLRTSVETPVAWRRTLDVLVIEPRRSRLLLAANLVICWVLMVVSFPLPLALMHDMDAGMVLLSVFITLFVPAGIALATWVEAAGIRVLGHRRGYRISRDVALAIVGHGSVGWVVMCAGAGLVMLGLHGVGAGVPGLSRAALVWGGGVLAVAGFLLFEAFAFAGMIRLRFANPPGARIREES